MEILRNHSEVDYVVIRRTRLDELPTLSPGGHLVYSETCGERNQVYIA